MTQETAMEIKHVSDERLAVLIDWYRQSDVLFALRELQSLRSEAGFYTTLAELDRLRAEVEGLRKAIDWVLTDMRYKAPEQVDDAIALRWYVRLDAAIDKARGE